MKKNELDKMLKKYQPAVKKAGNQLQKAMKTAEEDISKMYRIAQTHVEIQMKNLQKEKLYYELGKYVAGKLMKGNIEIEGLERYKKSLNKINAEGARMQRKLSGIGKVSKKKASKKSKTSKTSKKK
ncbi:MAG: hypothetical protein PVH45_00370 [Candidatus Omnitrophota bacterium]|jgi:hypothetical protein